MVQTQKDVRGPVSVTGNYTDYLLASNKFPGTWGKLRSTGATGWLAVPGRPTSSDLGAGMTFFLSFFFTQAYSREENARIHGKSGSGAQFAGRCEMKGVLLN
jgi:hypothetical protein